MIRGTVLSHYSRLVTELGGDPAQLLRAAGVAPQHVGDPDAFLPVIAVVRAIEAAASATAPTDFGRRLAQRQGIEVLGPVGVAARTAATVGDAFGIFGRYMGAYSPAIAVSIVPLARTERSFYEFQILIDRLPPHPHVFELALGVSLRVLRFFLGADYAPLSVQLPHRPLAAARDYARYFCCRPLFEKQAAGFTIQTADLSRPLNQDRLAHQAVVDYLTTITREPGIVESVRTVIRQLLPTGAAAIKVVAAQFDMHPKTLQRQLTAENTTFADLVDTVRRDAVERYLRDTDLSLSHLSREMGYAEQSVLSRSCRRWFGCGPSAYRTAIRSSSFGTPAGAGSNPLSKPSARDDASFPAVLNAQ